MLVRSLIERPDGTRVTVGGISYHFTPAKPNGPHVADVADKHHLARFLSIPEGYEVAIDENPASVVARAIIDETAPAEMFDPASINPQSLSSPAVAASGLMSQAQTMPVAAQEQAAAEVAAEVNSAPAQAATEEAPQRQMTEEELHAEELKASYELVLQNPEEALDTEVDNAFEYLAGRKPNANARRETKIDRILKMHQERVAKELNTAGDDDEE